MPDANQENGNDQREVWRCLVSWQELKMALIGGLWGMETLEASHTESAPALENNLQIKLTSGCHLCGLITPLRITYQREDHTQAYT